MASMWVNKQTPFKLRHSNHKQEIRKKIGGLGNHYGGQGCGYENLRIQIIDQVKIGDTLWLKLKSFGKIRLGSIFRMVDMLTAGEKKKT